MAPLYGIGLALASPHPVQRLSWVEAVRAYTEGAAHASWMEKDLGTIAPGKWADLVVLSGDPARAPWGELKLDLTFLGGERIHAREERA